MRLEAEGVGWAWRGRSVLQGASLAVEPGEVVALLGPNGAGKTTLMRLMLGLLRPQAGQVRLGGRPVAQWKRAALARQLAYVPQLHTPPFPYTVREVVMLGRLPHGTLLRAPGARDRAAVDEALERLELGTLQHRPVTEISGGERQRTLIARALAQGARLLVMDEPASSLDYGHQLRLALLLRRLAADGWGILQSTHHPEQVFHAAHRVALLQGGRIIADGPPRDVLTAERLHALYGVPVRAAELPGGRRAFLPLEDAA